jgi:hypothetical protein
MLILLDHGAPRGIARALSGHRVITAYSRGWDRLGNGELLSAAEASAVDLLLTTDRRIRYQQNLSSRKIALVVLTGTTKWAQVRLHLSRIAAAVDAATPRSYTEVEIPFAKAHRGSHQK